ncbi:hypothetical protein G5714_003155 [Onychostoma macrolepis]|uniref:Uncharacterized protein n=1 Tax=Onychostoma macrolepis TaxID=369639 RepID=A0A7J6D8P4_9TELE|nr:hypothetical protein G5714_003155 [Onychostoma macrolepis]
MQRFALSNLRDFGMGKRGSEEKIIEEIEKPFNTTQPVNYAVSNIISSIVYGSRFEYTDPQFTAMVDRANENVGVAGSTSVMVYNTFPLLGPFLKIKRILVNNIVQSREQMTKLINGLQETLNLDRLVSHPQTERRDRVQEEIDRVIGGRQPVVEDRKKLPYTDAVIHETQRLANIVPLSLPHITTCDVTLNGYFIKKGTTVVPLLTSVLKDPNEWEKPNSFYPEHFLDEKGQIVKRDAFMPFSAGRRMCLGESLARMELFLFFNSLLQTYCFTTPPGVSGDDLDLKGVVGLTLNPSPHKLCANRRS